MSRRLRFNLLWLAILVITILGLAGIIGVADYFNEKSIKETNEIINNITLDLLENSKDKGFISELDLRKAEIELKDDVSYKVTLTASNEIKYSGEEIYIKADYSLINSFGGEIENESILNTVKSTLEKE